MRPTPLAALTALVAACSAGGDGPIPEPRSADPERFLDGVVSTPLREYGISFAPDLSVAYFTRRGRRGSPEIFETRFGDGAWTEPVQAPFSFGSESPFLTGDGTRLVFSSRRALPASGDRSANLWEVRRTPEGWSDPRPLSGAINRPGREVGEYEVGDEVGSALLGDGTLIFSTGTDPVWGEDLYVAAPDGEGGFGPARPLRLSGVADESHPAVSPDGRYLVFQSYGRASGVGQEDLYVSTRTEDGWSDPLPLPEPVNSIWNDGFPSFTPDGRFLFFASDRGDRSGYYSIYYVSVSLAGLGPA